MNSPTVAIVRRTTNSEEQTLKKKLREALEEDRTLLMIGQPFTAMLAMHLNLIPVVDSRIPIAGTDGMNVFVNASHMLARSAADRRFILAHEVWHCALGHLRRQLGREVALWNAAVDYEVNHLLAVELNHCPADALFNKRLQGLSAEEIYALLLQGGQGTKGGQRVLDTHDLHLAREFEVTELVLDPDFAPESACSKADENALCEAWRQRLVAVSQQRERLAGELPGHLSQIVRGIRVPTVPWQHVLARFAQRQYGGARQWLPPSRRHIHQGLYLPSHRQSHLELTVALDNSGSCVSHAVDFCAELKGILSAFDRVSLRLLVFDTRVTADRLLDEHTLHELEAVELSGGGGTNFLPIFEACAAQTPAALVILTDGFGKTPLDAPPYPVLWALTDDGKRPVDWGEQLTVRR